MGKGGMWQGGGGRQLSIINQADNLWEIAPGELIRSDKELKVAPVA